MLENIRVIIYSFFFKGHERTLRAKKNVLISLILKGGIILVGFFMVPLTINYVNTTQYGIWLTLSSIIGWFGFFDIGLGNGLKNKLAETNARGETGSSRIYVSTTYAGLFFIALIIIVVFFVINPFLSWHRILNTEAILENQLNMVAIIVVTFFALQFIVQNINTILIANHAPAKASLINFIGQFFCFVAIFILIRTTDGSLFNLVLVFTGIPLIVLLIGSVWYFRTTYRAFVPSIKLVKFKYFKDLFKIGGAFFVIQIGAMLLFQTDNIVIIQILGPTEVTTFNVVFRLFSVIMMGFSIVMTPFWSAFTEAYTKNDFEWIRKIIGKLRKYWLYLFGMTLILFCSSPLIFKIWIGDKVHVPLLVSFFMALYVVGNAWLMIHCFFLNGIGKIKLQLYLYIGGTIVNIPMAILLGKAFGLVGVILSNLIIFILMGAVFGIQTNRILNGSARGVWSK